MCRLLPFEHFRPKRPFQRSGQIEGRVGQRARRGKIEGFGGTDQHGGMGLCRFALIGEFEGCGTGGGNQRKL